MSNEGVAFAMIGVTIVILVLVGFILYLMIKANNQFRKGVEWAEANSKGFTEWRVKVICASAFGAGKGEESFIEWWESTGDLREP